MSKISSAARAAQTTGNSVPEVAAGTPAPTFLDRGSNVQVQRPEHQGNKVAHIVGAAGANPTQAEYATAVAAVNALIDNQIAAGIMKSA